ncbi:E3 ubiquitin/ISG15 ligase TRIM25-like [Mantella aurantiaca]
MAVADLREELNCSICLNVYEDPVMLKCGHNFCSKCIDNVLRSQEGSGFYSCPQCRTQVKKRPALQRNIVLRNIAEHFQSTHPEEDTSGVLCTYCINFSAAAVKTCINCEASLCEGHAKVHNKSPEHVLIEPTTSLENRKCSNHKKILEYYCWKDSTCICVTCRLDGIHKGHQVGSLEDAFEKKKEELKNVLEGLSSQKEEATNKIQTLLGHKDKVNRNADNIEKTVKDLFQGIKKKLDALEKQMLMEVYKQKEMASNSITDLIQHLEGEIDKISKKIVTLEKMYRMADPLSFLQDHRMDSGDEDHTEAGEQKRRGNIVTWLHERMIYRHLVKHLFDIVNQAKLDTSQADAEILLDVDTAGNSIQVSKDLKTVSFGIHNAYPNTPRRFQFNQVLSTNIFSSRQHYWEVQTSETGNWRIGVAYTSIDTKGDQSVIGNNKKSWCLRRCNDKYSVMHDKKEISLLMRTCSSQSFGVYLDYEDGRLSFYLLVEPVKHIYTIGTTFTEPLHVAFLVTDGFVKIMNMEA